MFVCLYVCCSGTYAGITSLSQKCFVTVYVCMFVCLYVCSSRTYAGITSLSQQCFVTDSQCMYVCLYVCSVECMQVERLRATVSAMFFQESQCMYESLYVCSSRMYAGIPFIWSNVCIMRRKIYYWSK